MATIVVEGVSITIPLVAANLDEEDIVTTPSVATSIRESLSAYRMP